jgi:hypothetical protein
MAKTCSKRRSSKRSSKKCPKECVKKRRSSSKRRSSKRRVSRYSMPKAPRGYHQNKYFDPVTGTFSQNLLPAQAGCTQNYTADTCGTDPNCNWTMRGCVRRAGVLDGNLVQGPKGPGQAGGMKHRRSSKKRSSKKRKGSKKRSSKKRKGSKRH